MVPFRTPTTCSWRNQLHWKVIIGYHWYSTIVSARKPAHVPSRWRWRTWRTSQHRERQATELHRGAFKRHLAFFLEERLATRFGTILILESLSIFGWFQCSMYIFLNYSVTNCSKVSHVHAFWYDYWLCQVVVYVTSCSPLIAITNPVIGSDSVVANHHGIHRLRATQICSETSSRRRWFLEWFEADRQAEEKERAAGLWMSTMVVLNMSYFHPYLKMWSNFIIFHSSIWPIFSLNWVATTT